MSKVDELKIALRKAEEQEKINSNERRLILAKTNYIGKCTATHTFSRISDQFHAYATRVIDVELDDEGRTILICKDIEILRYKYPQNKTLKIEVGEKRRSTNSYHHFRYNITVEQFESLYGSVKADMLTAYDNVKGSFKDPDEYQTMGDHNNDRNTMANIEACRIPYLDLTTYPEFIKILAWEKCGLLVGNLLLRTEYTEKSLDAIIKRLKEHAQMWSYRLGEEDHRRAAILEKIKILLNKSNK